MRKLTHISLFVFFVLSVFLSKQTLACSVCYGDPSHPAVQGINWAILFLLGMIATILVCLALFFINLRKREKQQVIPNGFLVHERDRV